MSFDTYQSQPICVKLDTELALIQKAKKLYLTDLILNSCFMLAWIVAWSWVGLTGGYRSTDWVVAPIGLLFMAKVGVDALNGLSGVRRMEAGKTIIAEHGRIIEEYRFGRYAKQYIRKTKNEHVDKAVLYFNQLELATKENRQIVLPYDLFGSKEKMRSYADRVCENAGIELKIVEDVA